MAYDCHNSFTPLFDIDASTLLLFMLFVLGTNDHDRSVSFDYLAFIANRFHRWSDFHFLILRLISSYSAIRYDLW